MGWFERYMKGTLGQPEQRSGPTYSINDPALAEFLGLSTNGIIGEINANKALGITGFYRAVSIISGTIAGLPLKTYRKLDNDQRERVASFLDKPAGPFPLPPFNWKEMVMIHLLIHGEAFLVHVYNGAGAIVGLWPIHPLSVEVEWATDTEKRFKVALNDGTKRVYASNEMTHIMSMTMDGTRGLSPLTLFRNTVKLGLAGEIAAERSFSNGMLISGLVTPSSEDISEDEAKAIKTGLQAKLTGTANAGDIAVVNKNLTFTPWSMSMEDAQFLESREFQVVEFARMFGVPPHLLGATEKQTSWGTGVAEQNLGMARYTLMPWTSRIEEALSELLPNPRFVEFDYKGLLQGTPKDEIELLIEQKNAGLLTLDEARAILNLPKLPKAEQQSAPSQEPAPQEDQQGKNNDNATT